MPVVAASTQAPTKKCGRCGTEDLCRHSTPDGSPICFRCQLGDRLDELLDGPHVTITAALEPVREAVLAVDNPRTGLGWLARSRGADLLGQIGRGERLLSHATLDAEPPGTSIEHLRRMLVAAGALPERNDYLARLERFTDTLASTVEHADDSRVLRSFATWHVLHRLRASQTHRPITATACNRRRAELAAAAQFLDRLRRQRRYLGTCRQADVDLAAASPSATVHLLSFLRWATRQRLLPELRLPQPPPHQPARHFADDEDRWALTQRLLHDQSIRTADRVAGLLVLLYAQTPARIARLTVDDIIDRNSQPRLRLGRGVISLPEPLADLACRLPEHGPSGIAEIMAADAPWLFPGRQPDRPMHAASLNRRLAEVGVNPRAHRNTALLQLAAELPIPVVADLLGLHIVTADRWAQAASAGWSTYAAIRTS